MFKQLTALKVLVMSLNFCQIATVTVNTEAKLNIGQHGHKLHAK